MAARPAACTNSAGKLWQGPGYMSERREDLVVCAEVRPLLTVGSEARQWMCLGPSK